MERELEKDLKEIEYLIYVHKERENTHTQSVLERAHEIIETCAKAARTLPELEELLSRENTPEITRSPRDNKCGECSRRKWYMKGYEDALKEDGVSEEFLEDCRRTASKYKKENDGWVTVEDRTPEESGYYRVTVKNKELGDITEETAWFAYVDDYDMDESEWRELYEYEEVIAWRELAPYNPERRSDEKE